MSWDFIISLIFNPTWLSSPSKKTNYCSWIWWNYRVRWNITLRWNLECATLISRNSSSHCLNSMFIMNLFLCVVSIFLPVNHGKISHQKKMIPCFKIWLWNFAYRTDRLSRLTRQVCVLSTFSWIYTKNNTYCVFKLSLKFQFNFITCHLRLSQSSVISFQWDAKMFQLCNKIPCVVKGCNKSCKLNVVVSTKITRSRWKNLTNQIQST